MSVPSPTTAVASPVWSATLTVPDSVTRESKVRPTPRLPSEPNLSRQLGDPKPDHDYTVYLPPPKHDADPGPTYSNLIRAVRRKMA